MATLPAHFVLVTAGSAGDMYPFMALAKALQGLDRKVTLIGPAFHAGLVRQAGIPFLPIGTPEGYMALIDNPDLWHHEKGFGVLMRDYRSRLGEIRRSFEAFPADEACVVVAHPMALAGAALVRADRPGIRVVAVYLAPSNLRTCHDPLTVGPLRVPRWVPMAWRRALWRWIDKRFIDPAGVPEVNAARQAAGLPPIAHFIDHMQGVADLSLTLFPRWLCEPQPDWPHPLHMGGFPLYDPGSAQQGLPDELRRFLDAGEPPIVFTPGSAHHHADAYFGSALAAVNQLGRRAVFLTRHQAQLPAGLPGSVHWQPYVPLANLLPRAAALVHHGGIGTTAEALRAGVPQLVVPFAWDQFDNAARVEKLGVGDSILASRLRPRRLARRLRALLASDSVRARCRDTAARLTEASLHGTVQHLEFGERFIEQVSF
jgi:rhamnosyltransferase subunit B